MKGGDCLILLPSATKCDWASGREAVVRWPGKEAQGPPTSSRDKEDGSCLWPQIFMLRGKKVDELGTGAFHGLLQHGAKRCGHKGNAAWGASWGSVGGLTPLTGDCWFLRELAETEPTDNILEKWLHLTKWMTECSLGKVTWRDTVCFLWPSTSSQHFLPAEGTGEEKG